MSFKFDESCSSEIVDFFSDLAQEEAKRNEFLHTWLKSQGSLDDLREQSFAWILGKSGLPWLELDLDLPVEAMLKEAQAVQHLLVSHRSGDRPDPYLKNRGWKALPIHGISSNHTQSYNMYGYAREEDVPYRWTEIADLCPESTRFFKETYPCRQYFRVRYVVLEPGGYISPHVDRQQSLLWEVNLALNHPSGCFFRMDPGLYVPFRPASAFILDVSRVHAVVNLSSEPRFHMIVHGNPMHQEGWRDLIERSFRKFLDRLIQATGSE